jgi:hypothetical protein
VGLSGPIAYDYAHSTDLVDPRDFSSPNHILENVSGLLMCYDDLYFLSPHFCPQDMRDLPYVHFVTDDRTMVPRLEIAREQFKEALAGSRLDGGNFEFRRLPSIIDKMTAGQRDRYAIDSHTHTIYLPGSSEVWRASSTALENLVIDIGLASSLGLIGIDVVMNSVAAHLPQQTNPLVVVVNQIQHVHTRSPLLSRCAAALARTSAALAPYRSNITSDDQPASRFRSRS